MPNVATLLNNQLPPSHLRLLKKVASVSTCLQVPLYLVGGTVRDILSGQQPSDLDIVVVHPPSNFIETLAESIHTTFITQSQFGTFKLESDDVHLDIATARSESYSEPGTLPVVTPSNIVQDLNRRDFSLNAMAVSLSDASWGKLLDPFDGRKDLREGVIRVLHPNSFIDDATRILRAIRYLVRMNLRLELKTKRFLQRDLHYLNSISGDRLRRELELILSDPKVSTLLSAAEKLKILVAVHPALGISREISAIFESNTTLSPTKHTLTRLAALVYAATEEQRAKLTIRLNLHGEWARVVKDVGSIKRNLPQLQKCDLPNSQIYLLLRNLQLNSIEGCCLATRKRVAEKHLRLYLDRLRFTRRELDGDDIISLGAPRGPIVGKLLDNVLTARLDGLVSTRQDEETLVRLSLSRYKT